MTDKFDPFEARAGRDAGMTSVEVNNPTFSYQFRAHVMRLPIGWEGTCEDIRETWTGVQPTHHNAWGSCWGGCVRSGLLTPLPDQTHMRSIKSHARKTHTHRRVKPAHVAAP